MKNKALKIKLIVLVSILLAIITLLLLKSNEWIAEYIFARGFSRAWIYVIGHITSIFHFSIFELLVITAIILGIIYIVRLIKRLFKKQWKVVGNSLIGLSIIVLSIFLVYTATATMNYNRYPVDIELYSDEVTNEEILAMGSYYLNDFNAISERLNRDENGNIISPYTNIELADLMREEFRRLEYSKYFNSYVPLAKPMILSKALSYNYLLGISFLPTGEPNINGDAPCFELPYTMAHEMAHSLGVMRENEADLVATYITLTSENDFIRYSGYLNTFYGYLYSVALSGNIEEYYLLSGSMNPLIDNDYNFISEYWLSYSSLFANISNFFNDLYLKFQGEEDGTDSYNNDDDTEIIDTGEIDDEGHIIYEIIYSETQQLYFELYFNNIITD